MIYQSFDMDSFLAGVTRYRPEVNYVFIGTMPSSALRTGNGTKFMNLNSQIILLVPPIIALLASHPSVPKTDWSSLKLLLSGSAPLSHQLADRVHEKLKPHAHKTFGYVGSCYGLSESST